MDDGDNDIQSSSGVLIVWFGFVLLLQQLPPRVRRRMDGWKVRKIQNELRQTKGRYRGLIGSSVRIT